MFRKCWIAGVLCFFWAPLSQGGNGPFEAQTFRDIAYYEGPDAHPVRHKLDVHVPKGHKDFPVVFFVHGGAWIHGNKDQFGLYPLLARAFVRNGIGMVSINYRLSPDVSHPEHIRDVARAFAWTHKNIAKYGGRPEEIFVTGHSAGGHLVALLSTDETYLKEQGLTLKAVRGAIPISGVFIVPPGKTLDKVFGPDSQARRQASPITHANGNGPPFLIIYGENDLPSCDRPGAQAFHKSLLKHQVQAEIFEVPRRNHISILLNAIDDTDPMTQSILSFIMTQVTFNRLEREGPAALDFLGSFLARYAHRAGS